MNRNEEQVNHMKEMFRNELLELGFKDKKASGYRNVLIVESKFMFGSATKYQSVISLLDDFKDKLIYVGQRIALPDLNPNDENFISSEDINQFNGLNEIVLLIYNTLLLDYSEITSFNFKYFLLSEPNVNYDGHALTFHLEFNGKKKIITL